MELCQHISRTCWSCQHITKTCWWNQNTSTYNKYVLIEATSIFSGFANNGMVKKLEETFTMGNDGHTNLMGSRVPDNLYPSVCLLRIQFLVSFSLDMNRITQNGRRIILVNHFPFSLPNNRFLYSWINRFSLLVGMKLVISWSFWRCFTVVDTAEFRILAIINVRWVNANKRDLILRLTAWPILSKMSERGTVSKLILF